MDELLTDSGEPRVVARELIGLMRSLGDDELCERQRRADIDIATMGITFTIYSEGENIDRAWPFDIIPRVIAGDEWDEISLGLQQRLWALNRFIDDVYNEQQIIADGVFPAELLDGSA